MRMTFSGSPVRDNVRRQLVGDLESDLGRIFAERGYSLENAHFSLGETTKSRSEASPKIKGGTVAEPGVSDSRRVTEGEPTAQNFEALLREPASNSQTLRLPDSVNDSVNTLIARVNVREKVYSKWGLDQIDPVPRLALNFSGPPGTGKTLCAHSIARRLNKRILEVSYADVVSKYFGEAAKNLAALFAAAERADAMLFLDEAETLLSRRVSGTSEGSDHATNSMRSQLLTLLDKTKIICVFATNLIEAYDSAFISRLIVVNFPMPDLTQREAIWRAQLPSQLPVSKDVLPELLAARFEGVNGRQIWRMVVEASHRAAIAGRDIVEIEDFEWSARIVGSIDQK